jgi:hypothetical protein
MNAARCTCGYYLDWVFFFYVFNGGKVSSTYTVKETADIDAKIHCMLASYIPHQQATRPHTIQSKH